MARTGTFVMRNGRLVRKERAAPLVEAFGVAPFVISDTMPETRHMADGQYYSSKAKFREITKAHGCVEVGNETKYLTKPRERIKLDGRKRRDDIKKAIHQLRNK
jgi:hypothetical protein